MKKSKKFYVSLVLFSLLGQIAWVMENMYLNVFISEEFGASAFHVALMVSLSAIVATLTTLFIGALSDKVHKRKIFIWLGYILWGFSICTFALLRVDTISRLFPTVTSAASLGITLTIVADCVMTLFGSTANDATFNSWISDHSNLSNRGRHEGIVSMMPLLAILIVFGALSPFATPGKWWIMFLIIGVLTILAGIIGIFIIQESDETAHNDNKYFKRIFYGFKISSIKKYPSLYITYLGYAIYGIAIQAFMTFLIAYYQIYVGESYIYVMAPAIIVASISTLFYGRRYDKHGFERSILTTLAVLFIGLVMLACTMFTQNIVLILGGSFLLMIGYLCTNGMFGAKMRELTPRDRIGSFQGVKMFAQVLIPMLIGPWIGAVAISGDFSYDVGNVLVPSGYTYTVTPAIFIASAIILLVSLIPLVFVFKRDRDLKRKMSLETPKE